MNQVRTPQEYATPEWLIANAKPGDRVTIATPHGQQLTGRMVMRGPAGLVLNLGGPHGTPGRGDARQHRFGEVLPARRLTARLAVAKFKL